MRVPVVIRCECGREIHADAGGEITCECGRQYVGELSQEQLAAIHALGMRMRVFARLGVGVVGLLSIVGFLFVGTLAGVVVLAVTFSGWWFVLQPIWRRRAVARLAALPPATLRRSG